MSEKAGYKQERFDDNGAQIFREGKSFKYVVLREKWYREGAFGWTNERVSKLCHQIGVTLYELAAMLAMFNEDGDLDHKLVQKFVKEKQWPPYIGVLLTQIERDAHDRLKGA